MTGEQMERISMRGNDIGLLRAFATKYIVRIKM